MKPIQKLTITNSSKSTFWDCPYKYFLFYVMMLSPDAEPEYFTWGKVIHRYAEGEDKGLEYAVVEEAIRREFELGGPGSDWLGVDPQTLEWMLQLAPSVMGAHLLRFPNDDKLFEDLGVERKFSFKLPCGATMEGKVDKVVRHVDTGIIFNWERKTAAKTGDGYWNSLQFAGQPKGYLLATQKVFGFPARRAIYDIFKKPQVKQRKGETRDQFVKNLGNLYLLERKKYFERDEVPFEQWEIDAYLEELDMDARAIDWCMRNGIWPKHHPQNRIGRCSFESICKLDLSKGIPPAFRVRSKVQMHPELVGV